MLKPRLLNLIALFALLTTSAANAEIMLNQVGYYSDLNKLVLVADNESDTFVICQAEDKQQVFQGKLSKPAYDADAGMTVRKGDFSKLKQTGSYYVELEDGSRSPAFTISPKALQAALNASLKSFYLNRSSTAIPEAFGGVYARNPGHPDLSVKFHPSTGRVGYAPSPKGWYDAGDYGKYIVNGGFATSILLSQFEMFPQIIGDDLIIPESDNGISDLLDECRWELDWFLTMQDKDGGVFHKLTTLHFVPFDMPEDCTLQRYFIGKGTGATLNFAAAVAQAARIYKDIDPDFAQQCLQAAKDAWTWALAHPDQLYNNPEDVSTGNYGQGEVDDEFDWAGAQLYITTGDEQYLSTLKDDLQKPEVETDAGWGNTRNLAWFSLATTDSPLSKKDRKRISSAILKSADQILEVIAQNPARSPLATKNYHWGSNGVAASRGMTLSYAYALSHNKKYLQGMTDVADYLLGRNATGYCYLSGFGSKRPMNLHHRPSGGDGIEEPFPGFIVGGPSMGREDRMEYPNDFPAQSYLDNLRSFSTNEIAINWNAPFVFLLAALQDAENQLASAK